MSDKEHIFMRVQDILRSRYTGILATQGDVYPLCSVMGFAESEDCREIYCGTFRNTRKYRNIAARPGVSLLVDTRKGGADDFTRAQALTALGKARESDQEPGSPALERFVHKLPDLNGFIADPDCALITITVCKYILVSEFQHVEEYEI